MGQCEKIGLVEGGVLKSADKANLSSSLSEHFSLTAGGPTHQIQQKLGLIKPGSYRIGIRVAFFVIVTWIPLLILSAAQGLAIGDEVRLPFLYDFATYVRFLIAVPLLILAEDLIQREVGEVPEHFLKSQLIPEQQQQDY